MVTGTAVLKKTEKQLVVDCWLIVYGPAGNWQRCSMRYTALRIALHYALHWSTTNSTAHEVMYAFLVSGWW
jgi:hypothetical protein